MFDIAHIKNWLLANLKTLPISTYIRIMNEL